MKFIDARTLDNDSIISTDICIVGAGAAGITLATELDGTVRDVCLIEAGGWVADEETQSLYDLDSRGYPVRENFMSRCRYYGGSCNLWAGRSMRMMEIDFERRDWVPHSGWPLSYSDMEPYYKRAARPLRLPAYEGYDAATYEGTMTRDEARLFGLQDISPTVSLWAKRPMRFGRVYKKQLWRSRNIKVYLNANVTSINLNQNGSVAESVTVRTLSGAELQIKATTVVLACGGMENARLLLVSRDRHSEGIGNYHDNVGRYYMDHPRAVFGEVRLYERVRVPLLRGIPLRDGKAQFGIGMSQDAQINHRVLNHYLTFEEKASQYTEEKYDSAIQIIKILLRKGHAGKRWDIGSRKAVQIPELYYLLSPKELMPHTLYTWYAKLRRTLKPNMGGKNFVLVTFCEQPPDPESRVYLSEEKDRLGLNKLILNWRIGDEVFKSLVVLHTLTKKWLESAGIGEMTIPDEEIHFTDASHHMGTTRMSTDPKDGVVDADCRVHGLANLYVAGSSVFPTAGHANPTSAIVALAIRLADHLKVNV